MLLIPVTQTENVAVFLVDGLITSSSYDPVFDSGSNDNSISTMMFTDL